MNWYKTSNNNEIEKRIKKILKTHPFTKKLMNIYNIDPNNVDNNLEIKIVDLSKDFAKGNGKEIFLDKNLFGKSFSNFLDNNFHFVIHEFLHWLKRRHEYSFYFNDPEEIQSFVMAIAWEMINGKKDKEILKKIHPIVEKHFGNKERCNLMISKMFDKANKFLENNR